MEQLVYSAWHRTLGYSYFAMDIDFVELRKGIPKAVIEASLCTPRFRFCEGQSGVFNRFLGETGGFQFEVAWWVAKWLNVPAYVVCMGQESQQVHLLSLHNGKSFTVSETEFLGFINKLGEAQTELEHNLIADELELYELVEALASRYPDMRRYPYFSSKQKWLQDYELRLDEVINKTPRTRPRSPSQPANYPVKGETTGQRLLDYSKLREKSPATSMNIDWIEWRKDDPTQKIGRPAAIVRSLFRQNSASFFEDSEIAFAAFTETEAYTHWRTIGQALAVPAYWVNYTVEASGRNIGDQFYAFKIDGSGQSKIFNRKEYENWIISL